MGRRYIVSFEAVAVTAAQDLVQIKGATGKTLRIVRAQVGASDTTIPTSQMLAVRCSLLTATVTDGSGGTSPTPVPIDPADSLASFTAKANNTTPATSSGAKTTIEDSSAHIYNGYVQVWDREARPPVQAAQSFVFELLSTVSGTVHLSGLVEVEEI